MLTRRAVMTASVAVASLTGAAGLAAFAAPPQRNGEQPSIDALLVDKTVEMPPALDLWLDERAHTVPVVAIHLDAAGYAGLKRVLDQNDVIAGIGSGATLFCLERIGWDYGFRLTERSQCCTSKPNDDASRQCLVALLGGAHTASPSASDDGRAYRPSRADATLHAWIMRKVSSRQLSSSRREGQT